MQKICLTNTEKLHKKESYHNFFKLTTKNKYLYNNLTLLLDRSGISLSDGKLSILLWYWKISEGNNEFFINWILMLLIKINFQVENNLFWINAYCKPTFVRDFRGRVQNRRSLYPRTSRPKVCKKQVLYTQALVSGKFFLPETSACDYIA